MTAPYPRDLMRDEPDDGCGVNCGPDDCTCAGEIGPLSPHPFPIRPAANQPAPIGRDHDCVIRPEAQPVAVSATPDMEVRVSRLERDLDGLRRKVISMEPMPG